jgi:hypothetical protein
MVGTTALVSVLTGLIIGGGTFLVTSGPARPSAAEQARTSDVKAAYQATDESRKMFGLLSTAAVSSTDGLNSATAAVPEIFNSVDTAKTGADQLIAGLDDASSLSSALNQVSSVTSGLSSALSQVGSLQGLSAGARTGLIQLRKQLVANPMPGSKEAVTRIDSALANSKDLAALDSVDQLRGTLAGLNGQLQSASAKADQSLASAKQAAVQLRDGLAKLAAARPGVTKAVQNLTTGVEQLKVALSAIDGQLAVAQNHLKSTATAPTPKPDPGVARPLAWSLLAGSGGAIVTFFGIAAAAGALDRRRAGASEKEAAAVLATAAEPPVEETPVTDTPKADTPKAEEAAVAAAAVTPPAPTAAVPTLTPSDEPTEAEPKSKTGKLKGPRRNRFTPLTQHASTETNPWLPVAITGTVE